MSCTPAMLAKPAGIVFGGVCARMSVCLVVDASQAIEEPFIVAVKEALGDRFSPRVEAIYRKTIKFILSTLTTGFEHHDEVSSFVNSSRNAGCPQYRPTYDLEPSSPFQGHFQLSHLIDFAMFFGRHDEVSSAQHSYSGTSDVCKPRSHDDWLTFSSLNAFGIGLALSRSISCFHAGGL